MVSEGTTKVSVQLKDEIGEPERKLRQVSLWKPNCQSQKLQNAMDVFCVIPNQ